MYEISDKIILFLSSSLLYLYHADNGYIIIPMIISILISCLFIYLDSHEIFHLIGSLAFLLLCLFMPYYILFLPLILYDILHTKNQYTALFILLLFLINWQFYSIFIFAAVTMMFVLSYFLKFKTDKLKLLKSEYNELRDTSSKLSRLQEEKNQSLLKNQDYEVNLATLNERNRISKEIHDNIGHLLSRSILQVGALLTLVKDEELKENLNSLKDSLSNGMDQIRSSIHNMYEESIDLYTQFEQLVNDFKFCPVSYVYNLTSSPSLQLKYSFISIVKEALVNIAKHSNATKASIKLIEHPGIYQLIIEDNGTIEASKKEQLIKRLKTREYSEGMGINNMFDRINGFHGNINISLDQGYKIFISVPKK